MNDRTVANADGPVQGPCREKGRKVQRFTQAFAALVCCGPAATFASEWIRIDDASRLEYQTQSDGKVYVRNLNEFHPSALGCCYNYYFDASETEGKLIFALIMSRSAQGKGLSIGVPNNFVAGKITNVGEF